jgi:putative transposase
LISRMKVLKAYKFRLKPTDEQKKLLAQQGGNCRFLWNYFLELNQKEYAKNKKFIFAHDLITSLPKLKKEFGWLGESFSQSLQQVGRHFDRALKDAFKNNKGFPTFKKKALMRDSFTIPQKYRIGKTFVFIPKIGEVQLVKHRPIKGTVKHLTISQDGNQWYCSVTVELKMKQPVRKNENIVGIDVGLKTFATLSDGTTIENPKILNKYQKRLNRANRKLSHLRKDGKNREKQRLVVSKLHRKIRNVRKDFQHKTTHNMIIKYDGFVLEDLNIKGMLKNHKLARAISDAAWHEWKRQLKYKSDWSNKWFLQIDRWEPSSKTCCECGWYNPNLTLADREFLCLDCGCIKDRDENAAINIRNIGLKTVPQVEREQGSNAERLGMIGGSCHLAGAYQKNQEKECLGLNKHLCSLN